MAMGCCFGCILVMLNILFGLIAILFIAIGCVLHFLADIAKTYLKDMLDNMSDMFSGFGFSIAEVIEGNSTFSILSILKSIALPFIIIGVVLFVICVLGCCGVYCSNKTILIVYMAILGLILGVQIIAVIIVFVKIGDFREEAVDSLKNSINKEYEGRNMDQATKTNLFTSLIDLTQVGFKCCGIDSYKNFETAQRWQVKKAAKPETAGQKVPVTCCVMVDNKPKDVAKCAAADDKAYAYIDTPCFGLVDDVTEEYKTTVIAVLACILAFQAIILMLAICFCQSLGSKIGPI